MNHMVNFPELFDSNQCSIGKLPLVTLFCPKCLLFSAENYFKTEKEFNSQFLPFPETAHDADFVYAVVGDLHKTYV